MVVRNLDVVGISVDEPETDAPPVVDGDGMLSLPVPLKFVESVARRDLQVVEAGSQVDVLQLPRRPLGDLPRKPFRLARSVQLLRVPVRERLGPEKAGCGSSAFSSGGNAWKVLPTAPPKVARVAVLGFDEKALARRRLTQAVVQADEWGSRCATAAPRECRG